MSQADYRLMTEATGQRIAAALEALSGTGAAAAAARTNLDVYSKSETDTAIAAATDGRVFAKTVTATTNSIGMVFGSTEDIIGVANVQILGAYLARGSFSIRRRVIVGMYGNAGYYLLCEDDGNAINSQSVTLTVFYTSPISAN